MKKCIKCSLSFELTNFSKDKNRSDGYFPICKNCTKKLAQERKEKNKIRNIIDYCLDNNIGKIIIGKNDLWKQEIKMWKKDKQHFTQIPFDTLIQMIEYKAENCGIEVVLTEESYTSKIDHLAYEEMEHQDKYLGRRIKRGSLKSSTGKILNADINGAIGIARKALGDKVISKSLKHLANRGTGLVPVRISLH